MRNADQLIYAYQLLFLCLILQYLLLCFLGMLGPPFLFYATHVTFPLSCDYPYPSNPSISFFWLSPTPYKISMFHLPHL
jgi:hypothetical protein